LSERKATPPHWRHDGRRDEVDLEAEGEPAYYKRKGDNGDTLPKTGDSNAVPFLLTAALVSAAAAGVAARRKLMDR